MRKLKHKKNTAIKRKGKGKPNEPISEELARSMRRQHARLIKKWISEKK